MTGNDSDGNGSGSESRGRGAESDDRAGNWGRGAGSGPESARSDAEDDTTGSETASPRHNGDGTSLAADAETCSYEFDPSRETDARLQTTWECPHVAYDGASTCMFHMDADDRKAYGVTDADLVDQIVANLGEDSQRANEYVGADLPYLSFTYRDVDGGTNHVLNLQYADVDGLDLTHGTFSQGINLREARVGELKLDDATFTGVVEGHHVTATGAVSATEARFEGDVRLSGAQFREDVTFDEASFGADTDFSEARFHGEANFRATEARGTSHELNDHLTFREAVFRGSASFQQSTFRYTMFRDAAFRGPASFEHVEFEGNTDFREVVFEASADFDDSSFTDDVAFEGARFRGPAVFRGCRFRGGSRATNDDVTFEEAVFEDRAEFKLAQFRFLDMREATFAGSLDCDRAVVRARADCHGISVDGEADFERFTARGPVAFDEATFESAVRAERATFEGDASFAAATFRGDADFDETRFAEDATFRECTVAGVATFRGAAFEGATNHVDANTDFDEATFRDRATFESAEFVTASFWDTVFEGDCSFRDVDVSESVRFRIDPGDNPAPAVDLTDARLAGGVISEGGEMMPYDLTRATLGAVRLEGQSTRHELLDYFRFCLTRFDGFDFTNHTAYLERNDWDVHTFVGDDSHVQPEVELTDDVIEETYRRAQEAAADIGANDVKRGFEFRRWYYNRQKNWDLIRNEYSLNGVTRLKKFASVLLNLFFQYTCGYGNRVPRIFLSMGVLTVVYAVLYTLGGPFQTNAIGTVFGSETPGQVLFDAVYYSAITFTTIGYGDVSPVGWAAKILAASEGYLSAIMFTLLTVTLLRSAIGSS